MSLPGIVSITTSDSFTERAFRADDRHSVKLMSVLISSSMRLIIDGSLRILTVIIFSIKAAMKIFWASILSISPLAYPDR